MKIKFKPWMSLVFVLALLGIVGEMDYQEALNIQEEITAQRLQKNKYAGR